MYADAVSYHFLIQKLNLFSNTGILVADCLNSSWLPQIFVLCKHKCSIHKPQFWMSILPYQTIRHYYIAHVWPLHLILSSELSVHKICVLFWRMLISNPFFSLNKITYLGKLISSIDRALDHRNGVLNDPKCLVVLSAHGSIYLNVKDYETKNKHTITSSMNERTLAALISTLLLKSHGWWELGWWHRPQ